MKRNLRSVITSTSVLVVTGGVLAATALPAFAAATPPFEPTLNPESIGSVTLYNAAGNVITGGTDLTHLFDFAQASTTDPDAGGKASVVFANPQVGQDAANWPTVQSGTSETFPNNTYPGVLGTTPNPVNKQSATQANLAAISGGFTPNTTAGYANVYQIRVYTSGGTGGGTTGPGNYWSDDIQVNPSTGTWYVTYAGGQVATGTTTALTAAPSPAQVGQTVTLTAAESAFDGTHPAGSVQFSNGGSNVGSPVAVNGSGVATTTTSFPATGTENLSAVFTPTDTSAATGFSASTGTTTETVGAKTVVTTTTSVAANPTTATAGSPVTLTGTEVASDSSHPAGSIQFADGGTNIASPVAVNGSGVATLNTSTLAVGSHSITATFTPTDLTSASGSTSATAVTVTITAAAGACTGTGGANSCTDDQTIQVTVPVGTLTISTPYTASCPFNLGTLEPDSSGAFLTVSKAFGDPNNLAPTTPTTADSTSTPPCAVSGNGGITVTDLRSGGASWTASAQSTDFTDAASDTISGYNLGLTGLSAVHPAGSTAAVTTFNQPPASPVEGPGGSGPGGIKDKEAIATTTGSGFGTTFVDGQLVLNAPTATPAGTYEATVTFSVM